MSINYQFGDVDGLWAAVLAFANDERGMLAQEFPTTTDLDARVEEVVDLLWRSMTAPVTMSLYHLRLALPASRTDLERTYPRTAKEVARLDADFAALCERAFDGLPVDAGRLARVRSFLPGALRGIRNEARLSSYLDLDDSVGDNHILRETEAVGYLRANFDGVHEVFLRGRWGWRDFNEGDSFDGRGDEPIDGDLDRGYYRFDLNRYRAAYGGAPTPINLVLQSGRDFVYWGNGLVLAPASCRLLADLMLGREPIVDPTPYAPSARL